VKPLLVGEAPGPNGDPAKPLEGAPSLRLLQCMAFADGLNHSRETAAARLRDHFEIRNLLDRPMERVEGSKGTEWPEDEARAGALRLSVLVERGQPTVLLGKRVAKAWSEQVEYWDWSPTPIRPVVVIPHPSGIVRLWNDPVTRVRAGYALWQAVGKIPR
jgi:uracil-DNA glycosylase